MALEDPYGRLHIRKRRFYYLSKQVPVAERQAIPRVRHDDIPTEATVPETTPRNSRREETFLSRRSEFLNLKPFRWNSRGTTQS